MYISFLNISKKIIYTQVIKLLADETGDRFSQDKAHIHVFHKFPNFFKDRIQQCSPR